MAADIIVYTAEMCGDCQHLKRYMDEQGMVYQTRDIRQQPEYAVELEAKTGKLGVPFLVIDGEWKRGYDPGKPFTAAFAESLFAVAQPQTGAPAPENIRTQLLADQLEFARQETLKVAAGLPPEQRLFQLRPEKATPLWLLGHLANTINTLILRWMLEAPGTVSREHGKLFAPDFAGGTPPSSDPALYPAWEEVVALYDQTMQAAVAGVRTLPDTCLDQPLRRKLPEPLQAVFFSNGATLMRLISHDAYHRGQVGLLGKLI